MSTDQDHSDREAAKQRATAIAAELARFGVRVASTEQQASRTEAEAG